MFSNANSLKSKIMNMAIDFDVLRKALGNTVEKRGSKEAIDIWESQLNSIETDIIWIELPPKKFSDFWGLCFQLVAIFMF